MGDPSTNLTIKCQSETFRVHKGLLSFKSPVFRTRLERWETKGEIRIKEMSPALLSSMIHYIYTGKLADGWQDLDIQDVRYAARMYFLQGWMDLLGRSLSIAADTCDNLIVTWTHISNVINQAMRFLCCD